MADTSKATDGLQPSNEDSFDFTLLPDWDNDFVNEDDFFEFARALYGPEPGQDEGDPPAESPVFITALNDWRPIHQRVKPQSKSTKRRKKPRRGKDETREGFMYTLLKWPLLFLVFGWIAALGLLYAITRLYIYIYERTTTLRSRRETLRRELRTRDNYEDWITTARELDRLQGNEDWKITDEYAYYDFTTVERVTEEMHSARLSITSSMHAGIHDASSQRARDELKLLLEACMRSNFVGVENPRLYSETYYGTKNAVEKFYDEAEKSLAVMLSLKDWDEDEKREMFKHMHTNFGRTALCLSGGAAFAYYHFGVIKALIDADMLPEVLTGTSGGALVASLIATRTDEELKRLIVPALAYRIDACSEGIMTWLPRWWRTGARFDSVTWAKKCAWFCHGSMTFKEAYERTGRILNITCIPSDPHSPTILANYLTSPDCVIWSATLASAAVPGILNPVVLMKKNRDGTLSPYSFGHKWKDGSLRTDIPLKALNLHFNVNFSIVSQVNPHINIFFFSSRGTVGRPVTHRKGRGWRGGFLGSAIEQYIKLDLYKWLKVLRHLELLPRPLGQDWSEIWLQRFSGTITIWPKTEFMDFWYILSDPTPARLASMIRAGQLSTWPKLKFIANRLRVERLVEQGRKETRPTKTGIASILSEEDLQKLLVDRDPLRLVELDPEPVANKALHRRRSPYAPPKAVQTSDSLLLRKQSQNLQRLADEEDNEKEPADQFDTGAVTATQSYFPPRPPSPTLSTKVKRWFHRLSRPTTPRGDRDRRSQTPASPASRVYHSGSESPALDRRRSVDVLVEVARQSRVFVDDTDYDESDARATGESVEVTESEGEESEEGGWVDRAVNGARGGMGHGDDDEETMRPGDRSGSALKRTSERASER